MSKEKVQINDAVKSALKESIKTGNKHQDDNLKGYNRLESMLFGQTDEYKRAVVNTEISTGILGSSNNKRPLDYILGKVIDKKIHGFGDEIDFDSKIVDLLIENGAELSPEGSIKLLDHIYEKGIKGVEPRDDYLRNAERELFKRLIAMPSMAKYIKEYIQDDKNKDLAMKALHNGHAEAVPGLIAAGANQAMDLGDKQMQESGLRSQIFQRATSAYKGKTLQDDDEKLTAVNVEKIDGWNVLADVAAQMVIDRNAGTASKVNYTEIARDLVANGANIETVDMNVSTTKDNGQAGGHKIIHKDMLAILKDNIDFQQDTKKRAGAKKDFDLMKDALREGQDLLKAKILEDRIKRAAEIGGYKVLLDDAVHMLKKAVGIQVEETERDRLREKQKDIGRALRASGSLSSSVYNVVTRNVNFEKTKDQGKKGR